MILCSVLIPQLHDKCHSFYASSLRPLKCGWLAEKLISLILYILLVTLLVPPATDNDSRVCRLDQIQTKSPARLDARTCIYDLERATWVSPHEYDIRSPKPYCSILSESFSPAFSNLPAPKTGRLPYAVARPMSQRRDPSYLSAFWVSCCTSVLDAPWALLLLSPLSFSFPPGLTCRTPIMLHHPSTGFQDGRNHDRTLAEAWPDIDGTFVPRTDNCINIALVIGVGCHHAHVIHALVSYIRWGSRNFDSPLRGSARANRFGQARSRR